MRVLVAVLASTLAFLLALLIVAAIMPSLPDKVTYDKLCLLHRKGKLDCGNVKNTLHRFLLQAIESEFRRINASASVKRNNTISGHIVPKFYMMNLSQTEHPAIRVVGTNLSLIQTDSESNSARVIRGWPDGFNQYGVEVKNSRIVVPVSGVYIIYSYLELIPTATKVNRKPAHRTFHKPIRYSINRFSIRETEDSELASTFQQQFEYKDGNLNIISSFLYTIAYLKTGDELSVKCSDTDEVRHLHKAFFGVSLV